MSEAGTRSPNGPDSGAEDLSFDPLSTTGADSTSDLVDHLMSCAVKEGAGLDSGRSDGMRGIRCTAAGQEPGCKPTSGTGALSSTS